MSQKLISQIKKQLKDLESMIQNTSTPDLLLLKELSTNLDYFKDQFNPPKIISKNPEQMIYIWSDGACSGNPGPGGWGTIVQVGDHVEELAGFSAKTTNNIMEMMGAINGLKITPVGANVILTSDSQYVVKGMNQWIKGWKKRNWKKADGKQVLNQEYWITLDRLAAERNITWEWVKGHADHPQNERCDELARKAITDKTQF
jgi:ribonuclease HI